MFELKKIFSPNNCLLFSFSLTIHFTLLLLFQIQNSTFGIAALFSSQHSNNCHLVFDLNLHMISHHISVLGVVILFPLHHKLFSGCRSVCAKLILSFLVGFCLVIFGFLVVWVATCLWVKFLFFL